MRERVERHLPSVTSAGRQAGVYSRNIHPFTPAECDERRSSGWGGAPVVGKDGHTLSPYKANSPLENSILPQSTCGCHMSVSSPGA
eukprot:9247332-Pyramimonas_sp.AAC.2